MWKREIEGGKNDFQTGSFENIMIKTKIFEIELN